MADDDGNSHGENTIPNNNPDGAAAAAAAVAEKEEDSDEEDDQPFFSMISGTSVSKPTPILLQSNSTKESDSTNTSTTNGQIIEYKSEAAEFWKQREYKGLESQIGNSEIKAAVKG